MKLLRPVVLLLLISSFMFGQSAAPNQPQNSDSKIADQIKSLQDAIAQQQQQIQALQQELAERKKAESAPHLANAALTTGAAPASTNVIQDTEKPKESPLSFRIGGTDFTPGGFVDFNNIFRTVNTGSIVSTNWGAIPFSNTAAGHLTEYRAT